MKANLEIPYPFEALSLYLGVTPRAAASIVLDWFTEPMQDTGLLVHTQKPRGKKAKVMKVFNDFAERQGLSRSKAMDLMVERAQVTSR